MMNQQANSKFLSQIAARRAQMGRRGLKRKPPKWLHPFAIERAYMRYILEKQALLEFEIKKRIIDRLPSLAAQADINLRQDDFIDDIKAIISALGVSSTVLYEEIENDALGIGFQIANFNGAQYKKIIKSTLGVDPITNDEFLQSRLKAFARQNALLITNMKDSLIKDIEGIVVRGFLDASTSLDIQKEITSKFEVSRSRARLIVRDQTAKLNGQLTKARQERVDIDEYIWNSADDERVRDSHKVLDNKVCRWDDDTVYRDQNSKEWKIRSSIGAYVGIPGSDYQCRCFAEPIIEDFINVK
jgi:SPP1 gp7 family putative phage head morphogenesis protein